MTEEVSDEQVMVAALMLDHAEVLEAVLARFDDTLSLAEWRDAAGRSLVHLACAGDASRALTVLLRRLGTTAAGPVSARDRSGATPLFVALLREADEAATALLLVSEAAPDVNAACGGDCETPLQMAVEKEKCELVRLMMAARFGGDPTQTDMNGDSAFDRLVVRDDVGMFRALCAGHHATAGLFFACESSSEILAGVALECGANVDCVDAETGFTPLMVAADADICNPALLQRLIEAGSNVNATTKEKMCALSLAARQGALGACRLLIAKGALVGDEVIAVAKNDETIAMLRKPPPRKKGKPKKPLQHVREVLEPLGLDAKVLDALPKKWHLVGDVMLLQAVDGAILALDNETLRKMGEAYLSCPQIRAASVLLERISPHGELREPEMQVIAGRPETLTRHVEDTVVYWLDPALVMFSSGNGTERMHFRHKVRLLPEETVVDMFAGIGYFSIPLALSCLVRPRRVVSLEKNPNSVRFLRRNVEENGVGAIVEVQEGDNRQVGEAYVGRATRVLMGYIPTPVQFIERALSFLDPTRGGVIHYHFVATKEESQTMPEEHMRPELAKLPHFELGTIRVRTVKDFAPQMFHFVADVEINLKE